MASPAGNERALLTARVGAYARVGAMRVGFTPQDTSGGSANEFYIWTMLRGVPTKESGGADATWTKVK